MKIRLRSLAMPALLAALLSTGCAMQPTTVGTKVDDSIVTTRVKSALIASPEVKGTEVKVETVNGTVQLSGFVASQTEARRAADIASRVNGVDRVVNSIIVR